ncbi:hypothetical protein A2755_01125 [Candidatus Wolfebacteria bacterium RIFCSPHIGHO2_01_FULL_48_22]|uniref:Methyltransferase type 11 domain-containing protein n=2 Tax=Candidatus Wolfeibacteriota TaxID=1752735 RepID=A0A1F8DV35_9BACT|nr:MAG: hypothetical protein A2755_01125 [Candidatus Wolfebacteria bacterium RIFCSPHIGHO2_01_FULL_48_22]OGM93943.1 MAG: hypothetical protein A2935_03670 [Candidatus Wolfebacteria bacterium RIFCSPLOWO2_01_FULL_47_17b]
MNIRPKAAKGVNDVVVQKVLQNIRSRGMRQASVLDLGTGQGYNAWKLGEELKKIGVVFSSMCVDIDEGEFQLKGVEGVTFAVADLNNEFNFGEFDFVIATEVIEHLENPYAFIRGCMANLKRGGKAYFTTPNVDAVYSLVKILLKKTPHKFGFGNREHMMPMHPFMVENVYPQAKFSYTRGLMKIPFTVPFPIGGRMFGETLVVEIERQ